MLEKCTYSLRRYGKPFLLAQGRFLFYINTGDMVQSLCCHTQSGNGKGVCEVLDFTISILTAIVGGVICHYIIKWLDGSDNDN